MIDEEDDEVEQELTDLEKKEAKELGFVAAAANSIMRENNQEPIFNQDDPTSPLYEADPKSLDELFARIDSKLILGLPREITDSQIEEVVEYYRNLRVKFIKDQANYVKPGRAPSTSTSKAAIIERLKNTRLEF